MDASFLIMSLFAEWPLETTIGPARIPDRLVVHLRTALMAVNPDADRRYQSMQDMQAALAAYLESIWPGRSWA